MHNRGNTEQSGAPLPNVYKKTANLTCENYPTWNTRKYPCLTINLDLIYKPSHQTPHGLSVTALAEAYEHMISLRFSDNS